jgi:hypothetical protein
MLDHFFRIAALFFFSAASFGFLYFLFRYPRKSEIRLWGIRSCHVLGFLGVFFHSLWIGGPNEFTLFFCSALIFSVIGFEISETYLP